MVRTTLDRFNNPHGHNYKWYEPGRCHICSICGTAEHRNGNFWLVGHFSKTEPPCGNSTQEQQEWHAEATPDPEQ